MKRSVMTASIVGCSVIVLRSIPAFVSFAWVTVMQQGCRPYTIYTVAGIGIRLPLCANALRCKACQVQPRQFQTGFSILLQTLY